MDVLIKHEPDIEIENSQLMEDNSTLMDVFHPVTESSKAQNRRVSEGNEKDPVDQMRILLQEWGLDILQDRFSKNLIDVTVLDYILDVDIIDLCRGFPMRYRLILRHKIRQRAYARGHDLFKHKKLSLNGRQFADNGSVLAGEQAVKNLGVNSQHATKINEINTSMDYSAYETVPQHNHNIQSLRTLIPQTNESSMLDGFDEHPDQQHLLDSVRVYDDSFGSPSSEQFISSERRLLGLDRYDVPRTFTENDGFITIERLRRFSDDSASDYTFVKLVMEELWPEGFAGRTVTGRSSNNVSGCRGKGALTELSAAGPKIPLETAKVQYIRDRLLERRLILGDSTTAALNASKQVNKIMARIIAAYNNKLKAHTSDVPVQTILE